MGNGDRLATLRDEMASIHHANEFYWNCLHPTISDRAEYASRQERLEEIRAELANLGRI